MSAFTESVVEEAALSWLGDLGYTVLHGPEIAAGEPGAERGDPTYRDVVLEGRLRQALVRLNPELPHEALDDAFRKLLRADGPTLLERNRAVHRMLVDGVTVEYRRPDGSIAVPWSSQNRYLSCGLGRARTRSKVSSRSSVPSRA